MAFGGFSLQHIPDEAFYRVSGEPEGVREQGPGGEWKLRRTRFQEQDDEH